MAQTMVEEANHFGQLLKQIRKERSMSILELADRAKISERSIRYYENGLRTPSILVADRVFNALGISAEIGTNKHEDCAVIGDYGIFRDVKK